MSPLVQEMEGNPARWLQGLNAAFQKVAYTIQLKSEQDSTVSPLVQEIEGNPARRFKGLNAALQKVDNTVCLG